MNLKRSLALALSLMLLVTAALPVAFGAGETLDRLAGGNRWETAVEVSQEGWDSAETVVLANGRNYPDALAGVSLAYALDAPILLTEADSLVAEAKAEITRLGAAKVVILGGTGVISAAVADELEDMGLVVERISGADRFETAAAVAMKVAPAGSSTVVLASGRGYADALAAASYAAINGYPILLTEKNSLPEATEKAIEDLGATNIIVVGGTGVIAESAVAGLNVTRVSGSNREGTSVALAEHFNLQTNMYYLATGDGFADSVTGAVLAAKEGTGILLVRGALADVTSDFFADAQVVNAVIFGGAGVVSETVATAAAAKLVPAGGTGVAGWVTNGADATVSIGGKTATVNDDGFYRVVGVAPGAYTMTITKADHSPKPVAVKVVKDSISVLNTDLTAVVQDNIKIVGAVVDKATGLSLDSVVTFDVWNVDDAKWDEAVATVSVTDTTGVFEFTNSTTVVDFGDKVRVNISVDNYHPVTRTITLEKYSEANVLDGIELTAIKTMVLSGKVTSGTTLLVNADVTLKQGTETIGGPVQTDAEGLYTFGEMTVPSGNYTLNVVAAGYANSSTTISISEGVDKTQNVVMAPGYGLTFTLAPTAALGETFTIGDMTATLLKNNVEVASVDVPDAATASVPFAFTANSIAPGTYTLRITGEHVKTTNFAVSVVDANVVAYGNADFAGTLSGTVNAGAKVELINKSGVVVATKTTETADYAFSNLAAGEYKVRASLEGYITETLTDYETVAVNATTTAAVIALTANPTDGDIGGTIRTAGTLIPAEGATIDYYALNVTGIDAGTLLHSDTVAIDGSYGITGILPGSYTVVIRDEGVHETFVATQSIVAGDDLAKNYNLTVGGNASLAIKLTDETDAVVGTAVVTVTDANGEVYTATYDAVDTYELADLSGGTYTITVTYGGYLTMEVPVTIAKGTAVARAFELTPEGAALAVTVGVTGVDHGALENVDVLVFDADGKAVAIPATATDAFGSASFDVEAGTYTVAFYLHGYFYAERTVTVGELPVSMPVVILTAW